MAAPRFALSLLALMLVALTLTEGRRGSGPRKCCFIFNEKPIAIERVASYAKVNQQCPTPAVRLTTREGRKMCVRSSATWVKNLIRDLDAKAAPGQSSHL
ncbi:C-C motif chemokine 18-like [Aulostomus maculatus]